MKTRIIATIGPSSRDFKTLRKMQAAGMSIGRINTKYAKQEEVLLIHDELRKLGCKIIIDVLGNKISSYLKKTDFDWLAVSFTNTAGQLRKIRKFFLPRKIRIIAKIETKQGVRNLLGIIKECDGMMVARGDLGESIPIEKLPIAQKSIIKKCNSLGKFVITATEMLLSMTQSKKPTRAEVTDVANAVLDGSDAVMLSEETAIGKYPTLAVRTMAKIVAETERYKNSFRTKVIT